MLNWFAPIEKRGWIKQEVLLNLGRLDQIANNPSIQRLAIRLQELSGLKNRVDLSSFLRLK